MASASSCSAPSRATDGVTRAVRHPRARGGRNCRTVQMTGVPALFPLFTRGACAVAASAGREDVLGVLRVSPSPDDHFGARPDGPVIAAAYRGIKLGHSYPGVCY